MRESSCQNTSNLTCFRTAALR